MIGEPMIETTRRINLGPLGCFAADPGITDLAITEDGKIWADKGSGMEEQHSDMIFESPEQVREYAVQLCAQLGKRLDDSYPIADASTVSGMRIHAVISPIVSRGACISVRFPDRLRSQLSDLEEAGMFPPQWAQVLRGMVERKASVLISGSTGSGKTTLLKALLRECSESERIITVEETRELGSLDLKNHVSMVVREPNIEGAGEISLADLVKATVRMRPDRIVLGECRGEEIADLLRALNSGHHGGLATVHADSIERLPSRLAALGMLANMDYKPVSIMVPNAFDAVLHTVRSGGRRRISQIGILKSEPESEIGMTGKCLAQWDGISPPDYFPGWQEFCGTWTKGKGPWM